MKKTILTAAALSIVLLAGTSCSQSKKEEAENNIEQAQTDINNKIEGMDDEWIRERDEFNADVRARIEKNKEDIAELKAEAKMKKEKVKKEYEAEVDRLEKRNEELRAKLDNDRSQAKENWQAFKEEFNHDMNELGTAIGDLFKNNKK